MITHAQYLREGWCPHTRDSEFGELWCFKRRGHTTAVHVALSLAPNAKAYKVEWE